MAHIIKCYTGPEAEESHNCPRSGVSKHIKEEDAEEEIESDNPHLVY